MKDIRIEQLSEKLRKEFKKLIEEVVAKQDRIIPIIGNDCFVGLPNNKENTSYVPFQQWLVEELLGNKASYETKKEIATQGYRGIDLLLEEYKNEASEDDFFDDISELINNGIRDNRLHIRKDVKSFLLAGKFDVIVTTMPYNNLVQELKCGNKDCSISIFTPIEIRKGASRATAKFKIPAIYQIFGDTKGDFVWGEDDLLRFLHYLNQTGAEKGLGASELVKYMKDKEQDGKGPVLFMPIGCNNLPNWIFRFLWYPFYADVYSASYHKPHKGIWYKHNNDESFYSFLSKYKFCTFSESTEVLKCEESETDPVLKKLTEKLKDKANELQQNIISELNVQISKSGGWDIFISYAKEDSKFATEIYEVLTNKCKKTVWMDNRLNGGDYYWDAIKSGIEHSCIYLFLITNSYLNKAKGKNNRDEETGKIGPTGVYHEIDLIRRHILNIRNDDGQKRCIIPIVKEGTTVTYTDRTGFIHKNIPLAHGILENLPRFKEYEIMQTHDLFEGIQDVVCSEDNLEETLINIFKHK